MNNNDRLFKVTDAELIQHSQVVEKALPDDLADFTAFDSTITADYPATIAQCLSNVETLQMDSQVVSQLEEETQRVNNAIAACNTSFKTISYFAKKAFSGNKAKQKLFGVNRVSKIGKSQMSIILFMETLAEILPSYQEALTAAGCIASVFTDFPVQVAELKSANIAQEKAKKERTITTQDRIDKLNALYLSVKIIHTIAQIIYSEDPARLAKYSLPQPKSSNNNPDDLIQS